MSAARAGASARGDVGFTVALGLAALVPRLYVALAWAAEPVWDGHYYDFGARRIAAGFGYSDELTIAGKVIWHPWCHYPVGYSALLGFFYRVFGAGAHVAPVVNAVVGALLAVVTYRLARYALSPSRARARIAGILVAAHPGLILYSALVMTEPLAALLTFAAFARVARSPRSWRALAEGALVLGLGALVRPQALLCAPFLGLVVAEARWRRSAVPPRRAWPTRLVRIVGYAAVASALTLAPVLPWTARNCRVMDGCALVSTNAGWNLAIGAFPRATGRFETLRASDGCREVTGQVQQDRCWLEYGVAQIKAAPARWLALVPAKLAYTFDHESFAVEYLREARPAAWPEERRLAARAAATWAHRVLLAVAAFGAIALAPRRRVQIALFAGASGLVYLGFSAGTPVFWPLAVFAAIAAALPLPGRPALTPGLLLAVALLATTIVTHAVFFGEDRYHVVVTPALALLAAAALRRDARPGCAPG